MCTTKARRTRRINVILFPPVPSVSQWFALKPKCLDLDNVGQRTDRVEHRRGDRLVDLDQRYRVLPGGDPPEVEGRDIDLGRPERVAEGADKPRLVVIAHKQYVTAELGFESDTLD